MTDYPRIPPDYDSHPHESTTDGLTVSVALSAKAYLCLIVPFTLKANPPGIPALPNDVGVSLIMAPINREVADLHPEIITLYTRGKEHRQQARELMYATGGMPMGVWIEDASRAASWQDRLHAVVSGARAALLAAKARQEPILKPRGRCTLTGLASIIRNGPLVYLPTPGVGL